MLSSALLKKKQVCSVNIPGIHKVSGQSFNVKTKAVQHVPGPVIITDSNRNAGFTLSTKKILSEGKTVMEQRGQTFPVVTVA